MHWFRKALEANGGRARFTLSLIQPDYTDPVTKETLAMCYDRRAFVDVTLNGKIEPRSFCYEVWHKTTILHKIFVCRLRDSAQQNVAWTAWIKCPS